VRILLIIIAFLFAFSANLFAQNDFKTLDKQTYDYFINGDYKNLKNSADLMLLQGIDYYYLRMRLGILAYNSQLYSEALRNFTKAIEFSSLDTISREYIYYSYLFSGRKADANLYLKSVPVDKRNNRLKSLDKPGLPVVYAGSSVAGYDVALFGTNNLYYEAVKNSLSINAGLESYFLSRFKGTFGYSNYRKTGTIYTDSNPYGADLNLIQNQVYAKLAYCLFPGWEFSGFSHFAFIKDGLANNPLTNEYLGGAGIAKNGWKIRTGANFSFSNFSNSNQLRGEAYLTFLPFGNLNFYFTSGWMGQTDKNWGGTYQINGEIGLKVLKYLWLESGIVKGNSFLYARSQGFWMNNSFQIPATTIYSNIILLPGKKFSITVSPYYIKYQIYSWGLNSYLRTNELSINSFGGAIKVTYNLK
jgi:hypothetical protein